VTTNPLDTQVAGDHYKSMKIQPIEFSMANGLDACQHSVIKYVCRHETKGGLQDLLKARHFIDLLMELKYSGRKENSGETSSSEPVRS